MVEVRWCNNYIATPALLQVQHPLLTGHGSDLVLRIGDPFDAEIIGPQGQINSFNVLKETILRHCSQHDVTLDLQIPQREGRLLSQLHEQGEVLERSYDEGDVRVRVRLGRVWADRWQLSRFAPAPVP